MITVQQKKMVWVPLLKQRTNTLTDHEKKFDKGLFLIIFPSLVAVGWPYILALVVIGVLIAAHLWILYERYVHNSEIQWPIWVEWCTIFGCGNMLQLSPFTNGCSISYWRAVILILAGQVIIYGHMRKLVEPAKAYYYDLPTIDEEEYIETTDAFTVSPPSTRPYSPSRYDGPLPEVRVASALRDPHPLDLGEASLLKARECPVSPEVDNA